jgi:hypothetical protein
VDHYNRGGEANSFLDGGIEPLALTEREIDDLVALMFTLTTTDLARSASVRRYERCVMATLISTVRMTVAKSSQNIGEPPPETLASGLPGSGPFRGA